jgi:hypothetical protein
LNAGIQAGQESTLGSSTNASLDAARADTGAIAMMKAQALQEAENYRLSFYGHINHVRNTIQEVTTDLGSWTSTQKLWRFNRVMTEIQIPDRFAGTWGFLDRFTDTSYSYWLDRGLWGDWDLDNADPDLYNDFWPNLQAYMEQFHGWFRAELLAKVALEFAVLDGRQRCLEFFRDNIESCNTRQDHYDDLWAYLLTQFKTQEDIDGCMGRWASSIDALQKNWTNNNIMPDGPKLYDQLTTVKQVTN